MIGAKSEMRKRSKYRPRPVLANPVAWVVEGFTKLNDCTVAARDLRLRNHTALASLVNGDATFSDLDAVIEISNMSTALARTHGADWKEEIRAGADAVEAVQNRAEKWGKVQTTSTELAAILLLSQIHEAQLDATRLGELEKARTIAKNGVANLTSN